jgi:hypothetical protein
VLGPRRRYRTVGAGPRVGRAAARGRLPRASRELEAPADNQPWHDVKSPEDGQGAAAHPRPGLDEADIDRYEDLLVARFKIDPDREPERIAQIDEQREELLRSRMPRYAEV